MVNVTTVSSYKWPSGTDYAVAILSTPVAEIADRIGCELQFWNEDGLGPASGAALKLPSGRIVVLRELKHAQDHFSQRGPDVLADAEDAASSGPDDILKELFQALDFDSEVEWKADASLLRRGWEEIKERRDSG